MTENNNFLISNKRHCENFRERKKKRKKEKIPEYLLEKLLSLYSKKQWWNFCTQFFTTLRYRELHDSWDTRFKKIESYDYLRFNETSYLVNPRKNSKGTDIKIDIQNESSLRFANLEAYTTRSIDTLIYLYSSTRRRVRVAQFSREDCSYHPFETTTTTTRLRPLD